MESRPARLLNGNLNRGFQAFFFARADLPGHILWTHTEPSLMWLPFFLIRSLHFGHVPIGFSLELFLAE
jgi:hypothetical protein